jgi:hypothetical protein
MRLVLSIFVAVALALILGSDQDSNRGFRRPLATVMPPSPTVDGQSELDGLWRIVSVQRDGLADPVQVGAFLTFANGEVKFWPQVPQLNFSDLD